MKWANARRLFLLTDLWMPATTSDRMGALKTAAVGRNIVYLSVLKSYGIRSSGQRDSGTSYASYCAA